MIPIEDIEAARKHIADVAIRTPLIRLHGAESPAEIWLKLECLQPIGSFKIRGAANAIRNAPSGAIGNGVWTTSAGNMAQGVAWIAREEGVPATIVVPDHAPEAKVAAIERLGARKDGVIRGHALRHTVACRIVNQGGSIKEVADVLRHRSLSTSMIYAKLDHGALSGVALPWPGSPE